MSAAEELPDDLEHDPDFYDEEATLRLLDQEARKHFNMSGAEFRRRWVAGEFKDRIEERAVQRVSLFLGADYDAA